MHLCPCSLFFIPPEYKWSKVFKASDNEESPYMQSLDLGVGQVHMLCVRGWCNKAIYHCCCSSVDIDASLNGRNSNCSFNATSWVSVWFTENVQTLVDKYQICLFIQTYSVYVIIQKTGWVIIKCRIKDLSSSWFNVICYISVKVNILRIVNEISDTQACVFIHNGVYCIAGEQL